MRFRSRLDRGWEKRFTGLRGQGDERGLLLKNDATGPKEYVAYEYLSEHHEYGGKLELEAADGFGACRRSNQ